jgi:hypothetical protein
MALEIDLIIIITYNNKSNSVNIPIIALFNHNLPAATSCILWTQESKFQHQQM